MAGYISFALFLSSYSSDFAAAFAAPKLIGASNKLPSISTLRATSVPDLASETKPTDEAEIFSDDSGNSAELNSSWQENLETLLKPNTNFAERQIVLSDLLNSSEQITSAVNTALRDRNIDGLLTPTQKRLQEGTRAVARQITSDIIPGIAAVASGDKSKGSKTVKSPVEVLVEDLPTVVPKIGSRVLNAIGNQAQNNLKNLQEDIQSGDPLRGITRIQKQTEDFQKELKNVVSETPEGLVGPSYRVISSADGYEIREYEEYAVASTSMSKVDEGFTMDDLASGGEAFNALAAYVFGANDKKEVMEMTTPVTTTSAGEMRFYLKERDGDTSSFPEPVSENDEIFNEKGKVIVEDIPSATLAVAKFTGFVTEGEVTRQKDALLTCLGIDGVDINVEHGNVVPHVVFQYNPPYTLPVLRRNEIGVSVRLATSAEKVVNAAKLSEEWDVEEKALSEEQLP